MYHFFQFFAWHMGQSNYMIFTQTFKVQVWAFGGKKNSKEEHYGPSQPCPLIYPHWVVIPELLVSLARPWFVISAWVVTPLEPLCWCCLTLNLTACWDKTNLYLRYHTDKQEALSTVARAWSQSLFCLFSSSSYNRSKNPLVYTPRDAMLKITTTKTAYVLVLVFLFAKLLLSFLIRQEGSNTQKANSMCGHQSMMICLTENRLC